MRAISLKNLSIFRVLEESDLIVFTATVVPSQTDRNTSPKLRGGGGGELD